MWKHNFVRNCNAIGGYIRQGFKFSKGRSSHGSYFLPNMCILSLFRPKLHRWAFIFCLGKSVVLRLLEGPDLGHTTEGWKKKKSTAPGGNQTNDLKSFGLPACALPLCYNRCLCNHAALHSMASLSLVFEIILGSYAEIRTWRRARWRSPSWPRRPLRRTASRSRTWSPGSCRSFGTCKCISFRLRYFILTLN